MPEAHLAARAKLDSVDLWTDVARDLWQVEMPNGSVCAMSVDELDAAFERGEIGLRTRVQSPSGADWHTLAEAAGVAEDSIRPVSSEIELIEIPRPPPLPRRVIEAAENLTTEDLSVLPRPRKTGSRLALVAMIGLLVGGVAAWRYMPAQPAPAVATTTIPAPTTLGAAPAKAADVTAPAPAAAAPETTPAPEENAAPLAASVTASIKAPPAKKAKSAAPKKALTWKQRAKLQKKKHA